MPPPDKKECRSAPFRILHPSAYSLRSETEVLQSYGAKTEVRTDAHAHVDSPSIHNRLAQPHIASISSEIHQLSHAGTILEVWSELLLLWLDSPHGLHPSACVSDFRTCPQTPPLTRFNQKGCQSTGLELKIPLMYLNFRRIVPGKFWSLPKKIGPPLGDPPPPPSADQTHTYTIYQLISTPGFQICKFESI